MADQKPKSHAGEGHLVSNIVTFAILLVIFALGFYALNFATLTEVWPFSAVIGLVSLAYFVPMAVIGRSDTHYDHS